MGPNRQNRGWITWLYLRGMAEFHSALLFLAEDKLGAAMEVIGFEVTQGLDWVLEACPSPSAPVLQEGARKPETRFLNPTRPTGSRG